jgi:hypothetical protein
MLKFMRQVGCNCDGQDFSLSAEPRATGNRNRAVGGELAFRSASQHPERRLILNRSTISQLRDDIDTGRTGDKVDWPDPAAAPLGTDEEAAGTPPDSWAVETARTLEISRPCKSIAQRGVGAGWLLIAFAAALGMGLVAWLLWQSGWGPGLTGLRPPESREGAAMPPRVVIAGAGFGGLEAAKALARAPVRLPGRPFGEIQRVTTAREKGAIDRDRPRNAV